MKTSSIPHPLRDATSSMRILIVEDEIKLAKIVRRHLQERGIAVDVALRGTDALWMVGAAPYDAIVLDRMLPDLDGLVVCRRLRAEGCEAPIIMLTARGSISDRVDGLDAGADDYLVKPFALAELLARLRALARRSGPVRSTVLACGDLRLDAARHEVSRAGVPVCLTPREFALLEELMRRAGDVVSRSELLEHVWDVNFEQRSNVIDVYVRHLREKIDRPFGTDSLRTVRGVGYQLREESA
jgi:two-component system OmpR family response regulator